MAYILHSNNTIKHPQKNKIVLLLTSVTVAPFSENTNKNSTSFKSLKEVYFFSSIPTSLKRVFCCRGKSKELIRLSLVDKYNVRVRSPFVRFYSAKTNFNRFLFLNSTHSN